eukprot:gene11836-biopygen9801
MAAFSDLPPDLVKDIVLRILTQEPQFSISDVALVCRPWYSIVSENLAQILIHNCNDNMPWALSLALRHNQVGAFDVAIELVSRSTSLDDSNQALLLVCEHGRPDLAMLLLTAPHHAAHANCENGQALTIAATHDYSITGMALSEAAFNSRREVFCWWLHAPQHGQALVEAARRGHREVVQVLLDAPEHAAHADCQNGQALVEAAAGGHREVGYTDFPDIYATILVGGGSPQRALFALRISQGAECDADVFIVD